MGRHSTMTVEQLEAEIADYRGALKKVFMGGVGAVVGEGRRLEFTRPDTNALKAILRDLEAELARRPGYEHLRNRAIGVEIG